jgi:rfaE bifunctional protein kinase chain/domain
MIKNKIEKILAVAGGQRICIIGDVMLDKYMVGDVTRISPEAPVQVFDIRETVLKLGGAANVSLNIKTLGVEPFLIGVIGNDLEGEMLKRVMSEQHQDISGLIAVNDRSTTCKTRVIASSHHLLRIDSESKSEISKDTEDRIFNNIKSNSGKYNIIVLQDYNKGVLTKSLIRKIIKFANDNNIKVLVDPKFENFFEYKNVFVFKPNRKELEDAFGRKAKNDEDLLSICGELIRKIKCDNLILTLGEKGIKMIKNQNSSLKISSFNTRARNVADVSGAGDTVISTMAVCIAGGSSLDEAIEISNIAAGIVVEEVGIVPIEKKSLLSQVKALNI